MLSLGTIDKEDITYFNNEPVGKLRFTPDNQSSYCFARVYQIPGRLLKSRKNILAVRTRSEFYDGGLPASPFSLKIGNGPNSKAEEIFVID